MGFMQQDSIEITRIKKFVEILRTNDILKNKLICVNSKKVFLLFYI